MLQLRDYQQRTLDVLQAYLRRAEQVGARAAFDELDRVVKYRPVPKLPELPYVCLRVPTGGGKTLMACHALGMAARDLLHTERPVCLWLVPTNAILEQTLGALRKREHPYRQALDVWAGGQVNVLDVSEALYVTRGSLDGAATIIVATLAAFRVTETEGRKVYETNGALQHHFSGLNEEQERRLERDNGVLPYSFANVLRLHRPIVIVDEAHNARTPLSFETLARFQPSCIIEFTATPETKYDPDKEQFASNVLYQVSAAELKEEEMIKLPVRLEMRADWPKTVAAAIAERHRLEEIAKAEEAETGEYIRPVLLLQAQSKSGTKQTQNVDVLEKHLRENHAIPEDQIAIATGDQKGLTGVNLFSRDCRIRYVITVQALKEGWDCSFAYVLCSVAEVASARSVEQLLGRVLRLPNAKRKHRDDLNRACVFAPDPSKFAQTLTMLQGALLENGFQKMEAAQFIEGSFQQQSLYDDGPLVQTISESVPETPDLTMLPESLREQIAFDAATQTLSVTGPLNDSAVVHLQACFTTPTAQQAVMTIQRKANAQPTALASSFGVPQLAVRVDGQLKLFEEDDFLDAEWKLTDYDAALSEAYFPSTISANKVGQLDITSEGHIEVEFVRQVQQQLWNLASEPGWDIIRLVNWIDRQIPHHDIVPAISSLFIHRAVTGLMEARGLTVEQLAQHKYPLKDALARLIDDHRRTEGQRSFQRALFEGGAAVEVNVSFCFHFRDGYYAPNWCYEGNYKFKKHFFRPNVGELDSKGEEFECAKVIDEHPNVKWWVRNLAKRIESSFWLQTSTDRFYPDFVVMLKDQRILVIEYKNEVAWSNDDSKEKRLIGELWAARSGGKCLFFMPKGKEWDAIAALMASI